jgi:hypothetical protein
MRRRAVFRYLLGLALLALAVLLTAWPAVAAETEIVSAGPLTGIIIGDDLTCQVAYRGDADFEFFPPASTAGDCGTFLALAGVVYGPLFGNATQTPWTLVSQSAVSGNGSAGDPFRLTTVVAAGATGVRLEQTDSYVVGSQSYRTEIRLLNAGPAPLAGILYRAGDCYLQESDVGFGRVDGGAPACVVSAAADARIELWLPITPGSHYMEAHYGEVFDVIADQRQFPDTCRCDEALDNGAGLSWPVNVPAGGSTTIVHETFFSPVGRAPVTQSFSASVPGPTGISLDPIVIAQSAIVTAGVVLLIPFPAALFNETFEANYAQISGTLARLRAAARRAWRAGIDAARRRLAAMRAPSSAGAPPATGPPPAGEPAPAGRPRFWSVPGRDFWATPAGILLFLLPSAVIYSFLDPTFGLRVESLATTAGLAIGLAVAVGAYAIPLWLYARTRGIPVVIKALPVTLLIGVFLVVLSRIASFEPGYVYGLVIGALFATAASDEAQGRAEAIGAAGALTAAGVAWLLLLVVRGAATADLASLTIETAVVTVVVAGVETATFAMLPLRFMPGAAVFIWNRRLWALLFGIGMLGFVHVLLNPTSGYLGDQTRSSFLSMVVLFAAFGLGSVAFWAWFRFRPRQQEAG